MGALRSPIMPEFCTCGAELPPDARFCHRCGKPQREEIEPETVAPIPPGTPAVVAAVTTSPEATAPAARQFP
jgi:predicted amidophosphoribosyltransferase